MKVLRCLIVALLAVYPVAANSSLYPNDPLGGVTGTYVNCEFMQISNPSKAANGVHGGVDVEAPSGSDVVAPMDATEWGIVASLDGGVTIWHHDTSPGYTTAFSAQHVTPMDTLKAGDKVFGGDWIGTTQASDAPHFSIYFLPVNPLSMPLTDRYNPRRYAFENASWMADSSPPVFEETCVQRNGAQLDWQIWAYDETSGSTVRNGVTEMILWINETAVDFFDFDRWVGKDGTSAPQQWEFYFDTSQIPPDKGLNIPNVINYRLSWNEAWVDVGDCDIDGFYIWVLEAYDAAGNRTKGDRDDPTAFPAVTMGGEISNGLAHIEWVVSSRGDLEYFDVLRSAKEAEDGKRVNVEPIVAFSEDGKFENNYQFVDRLPDEWSMLWYRVRGTTDRGDSRILSTTRFERSKVTKVTSYPNPFNPMVFIKLELPFDSEVDVAIFNVKGEKIRSIDVGERQEGTYRLSWDGTDAKGNRVASGIYLVRAKTSEDVVISKIALVR
jgi:hypothetical protein